MRRWSFILGFVAPALLTGMVPAVGAVTVHTWVDDKGVRHYADAPPQSAAAGSPETFEIAPTPATDSADDYYSIANQWERLRAERAAQATRELERERLRRDSALAEQARAQQEALPDDGPRGFVPWGLGPPAFGAWHGARPDHGRDRYDRGGHGPDRQGRGRTPFPIDRDAYVDDRRRRDFMSTPAPRWPRERHTPGRQ